jgi:hypothetical protein
MDMSETDFFWANESSSARRVAYSLPYSSFGIRASAPDVAISRKISVKMGKNIFLLYEVIIGFLYSVGKFTYNSGDSALSLVKIMNYLGIGDKFGLMLLVIPIH